MTDMDVAIPKTKEEFIEKVKELGVEILTWDQLAGDDAKKDAFAKLCEGFEYTCRLVKGFIKHADYEDKKGKVEAL